MRESLPPWLLPLWRGLRQRDARLPHAILLSGPQGSGKRLFAEHLAAALVCVAPQEDGFACGHCKACTWLASGNHPDHFVIVPAADEAADDEAEDNGKKEKARSTQIVIDQVRALQAALEVGSGGHAGGRRVVLIDPAEAMNTAAANALLKSLEEPGEGVVFVLASDAPRSLLPTIRSRCQVLEFLPPAASEAGAWLQAQGVSNPALLGFASGLPLAARRFSGGALTQLRSQLAADLSAVPPRDPLRLASEWEARIKLKATQEAGFSMPDLVDWVQRWLSDGARVAAGSVPRFFADHEAALRSIPAPIHGWLAALRDLQAHRRSATHPLNPRLYLEDLFLTVLRRLAAR